MYFTQQRVPFDFKTHRNPLPVSHMYILMEYTALEVGKLFPPEKPEETLPCITRSISLEKLRLFVKEVYVPESR